MRMINDKGEARTARTSGSSKASAPPLSWAVTASNARAGPLPSGPRTCPWAPMAGWGSFLERIEAGL